MASNLCLGGGGSVASRFTPQLHTSPLASDSDSCEEEEEEEEEDVDEELPKLIVKATGLGSISGAKPHVAPVKRQPGQLDVKSMGMCLEAWRGRVANGAGPYSRVDETDRMALVEAVGEANIALQEIVVFLDSLSQCVAQCETYKLSRTQWDTTLLKLMDDVERRLVVPDYGKRESELQQVTSSCVKLDQDVKKSVASAEEKRQVLEDSRRLDREIGELTAVLEAQTLETAKVQREFQASQDKLAFVRKTAATTKQRLEQQVDDIKQTDLERKQHVAAVSTARSKLSDAIAQCRRAEERLRVSKERLRAAKEQAKLRAAAAAAAQEAQLKPTHCVFCGESKAGLGMLLPCRHGMCIACLEEGQEMGKLYEMPFFHPTCNECDATLERIAFPDFEFDPLLGMRTNK